MMMFRRYLNKPEYLWRPAEVFRRLRRGGRRVGAEKAERRLPWGLMVRYWPNDVIGAAIDRMGIYDLALSEVIWRLLDPGETAYDVGANIGYTASLMAARVGQGGAVYAFEPHPEVFGELEHNVALWRGSSAGLVHAHQLAVADVAGRAVLSVTPAFDRNRGTATLSDSHTNQGAAAEGGIWVDVVTLDNFAGYHGPPRLIKIDVEGHEPAVARGAIELLRSGEVRDVVFEEHGTLPTPMTTYLTSLEYEIFECRKGLLGPSIASPVSSAAAQNGFDPNNLLATRDPARARQRLIPRGWQVLRPTLCR